MEGRPSAPGAPRLVRGWNSHYRAVYRLSFSALRAPGSTGSWYAEVPGRSRRRFRIEGAGRLYGKLLRYGVEFDQVQRDGRDVVPGRLHRSPSHLLDRRASVYAWPSDGTRLRPHPG